MWVEKMTVGFSRGTANWKALNNTATLQSRFWFLLLAETNSGLLLFEGDLSREFLVRISENNLRSAKQPGIDFDSLPVLKLPTQRCYRVLALSYQPKIRYS